MRKGRARIERGIAARHGQSRARGRRVADADQATMAGRAGDDRGGAGDGREAPEAEIEVVAAAVDRGRAGGRAGGDDHPDRATMGATTSALLATEAGRPGEGKASG